MEWSGVECSGVEWRGVEWSGVVVVVVVGVVVGVVVVVVVVVAAVLAVLAVAVGAAAEGGVVVNPSRCALNPEPLTPNLLPHRSASPAPTRPCTPAYLGGAPKALGHS